MLKRCLPLAAGSLAILSALLGPRTLQAAPANPPRLDEKLFLLYALDDMYAKVLPVPRTATADVLRRPPEADLLCFIAQRRLTFDRLRRHIEKKKIDPAILQLYRNYERELDLWKPLQAKLQAALARYCRTNQIVQQAALYSGLQYGLASYFSGNSGERAVLDGWLKAAQISTSPTMTQIQRQARVDLDRESGAAIKEVLAKVYAKNRPGLRDFHESVSRLCQRYRWGTPDLQSKQLSSGASDARESRNPFLVVGAADAFLKNEDATREELHSRAKDCQSAAQMVPALAVYNYYRAAFLGVGGVLANRAAAKDLGTTGFVDAMKNPPASGRFALTFWTKYILYEPIDINVTDTVLHQYLMACGHAGRPGLAYAAIVGQCMERRLGRLNLRSVPTYQGDFWFDCARISSLQGDVNSAAVFLRQAIRCGYRDAAGAKLNPDLKNVRQHRVTAEAFRSLFP